MKHNNKKKSEIWAMAGGKGGVGKSFALSSMGTYLALKGFKVVLVDADLGGANLHTFLCVERPRVSLTDFFDRKMPLSEIVVGGGIENLGLVAGTIRSLAADSIKYSQKLKLLRHIRQLDVDFVLIDLGAGSSFNTIDTFLLADKMIVLIVPEIIALENMYFFVKNTFFRKLIGDLNSNGFKNVVRDTWVGRNKYGITNLSQLVSYLKDSSERIKDIVEKELTRFNINIVMNKVRANKDITLGNSVKSICLKYLGINAQYVGYVEYDNAVSRSINSRQQYMLSYPESRCAREIEKLANNLIEQKQVRLVF
ncbi:P-loop NTPase [Thermodesulfobacteriota bacterium]